MDLESREELIEEIQEEYDEIREDFQDAIKVKISFVYFNSYLFQADKFFRASSPIRKY